MKPHVILLAALASASLLALAQPPAALDPSWQLSSESMDKYEVGVDASGYARGGAAKFLRARPSASDSDWATLMQTFSAAEYRGKRLRFEAQVKSKNVSHWSGLWMRVDCDDRRSCAFYNSQDKPIKGTNDWVRRSVTLDVPKNARAIAFGVINGGRGTVWIDALSMEAVGNDVPVDSLPSGGADAQLRSKPVL